MKEWNSKMDEKMFKLEWMREGDPPGGMRKMFQLGWMRKAGLLERWMRKCLI